MNKETIDSRTITVQTLNVTYEPLWGDLPEEVKEFGKELFAKKDPNELLVSVNELIKKYPTIPQLDNWKIAVLQTLGSDEESLVGFITEHYKKHPSYLFAKQSYAQLCMNQGDWQKVPSIFENCYTLNNLYPKKPVFHISEVLAFYSTVGQYFCYKGDSNTATVYMDLMSQMDSNHEAGPTKMLLITIMKCFPNIFFQEMMSEINKKYPKKKRKQ